MVQWIIQQKWSDVLFVSFEVDYNLLRSELPKDLEVDTFNGRAYLSIVPFVMSDIRFFFTPPLPFSKLSELNLRTYVRYKNKPGIYFFTLDSDHKLGNFLAQKVFNLPYRYAILDINLDNNVYNVHSKNSLSLKVEIKDKSIMTDLSNWIAERYCLYNIVDERVSRGDVLHPTWNLKEAEVISIDNQFSKQFNLDVYPTQYHCFYSKEINVRFRPFVYNI